MDDSTLAIMSRAAGIIVFTHAVQRIRAQLHQTALTANAGTEPLAARMPPQID
jgi:hypothetical protein